MSLVSPKSRAAEEEGRVGRQDSHNASVLDDAPEPHHASGKTVTHPPAARVTLPHLPGPGIGRRVGIPGRPAVAIGAVRMG
ncbi:hypothetical protein Adu01nite_72190 [Paractinoplanes durhamensis]|uniref:Uncharacterized protein n=1 Tax=Paractinoplanes durhamensis TaxID=113563 RepID=A0ABQ3Z7T8_9ACTN|nr:hypothetical protein Adu01nite_72190 [Actinoplanes durhamensis]